MTSLYGFTTDGVNKKLREWIVETQRWVEKEFRLKIAGKERV